MAYTTACEVTLTRHEVPYRIKLNKEMRKERKGENNDNA